MASPTNNPVPMNAWQAYTPSLIGATDNPAPTYSNQLGRFLILAGTLFYKIRITTTTMTKTTTTDNFEVTLPETVGGVANELTQGSARIENGTAVANASIAEAVNGNNFLLFRYMPATAASGQVTYAATAPGIGVLTNTINFVATGFFEL